ncbi:hypothetical protein CPB97_008729 [Podila verticillata]|nr:hypothetical protein CPB97_008729 [Podila verticillata]
MSGLGCDLESNSTANDGTRDRRRPFTAAIQRIFEPAQSDLPDENGNGTHERQSLLLPTSACVQQSGPLKIHCYSVSASGDFVATLSLGHGHSHGQVQIDLWDIRSLNEHESSVTLSLTTTNPSPSTLKSIATCNFKSSIQALERNRDTTAKASVATVENDLHPGLRVSVSRDGSQIAMFSTVSSSHRGCEKFRLFNHKNCTLTSLDGGKQVKLPQDLQQFIGYAKFVNTEKDERFIACDGEFVSLYSTQDNWQQLYTVQVMAPPDLPLDLLRNVEGPLLEKLHAVRVKMELPTTARVKMELPTAASEHWKQLIDERLLLARFAVESAQGEYFLWHKGWSVSVWDLELGSMVSCISLGLGVLKKKGLTFDDMKAAPPSKVEFLYSANETIALRVAVTKHIKLDIPILFSAETGQEQESEPLSQLIADGQEATALSKMLEQFDLRTDGHGQRMPAFPAPNISNLVGVLNIEPQCYFGVYQWLPDSPAFISLRWDSKLEIRRMQAITSAPIESEQRSCSKLCAVKKPLKNCDSDEKAERPGGLRFHIKTWKDTEDGKSQNTLDIRLVDADGKLLLRMELEGSDCAYLFPNHPLLIILGPEHISVWGFPTREEEPCQLLLHWAGFPVAAFSEEQLSVDVSCIRRTRVQYKNNKMKDNETTLDIPLEKSQVFTKRRHKNFVAGVDHISARFAGTTEKTFRDAVIQYLGTYINSTPYPGNDAKSTMSVFCDRIYKDINLTRKDDYNGNKDLVIGLLHSGWVPREKYTKGSNPLDLVLNELETQEGALDIAEEMVRWCHKKAKDENCIKYIYIVLECMPTLIQISRRKPGLVLILVEIIQMCFDRAKKEGRPEDLRYLIECMPELQALHPSIARKVAQLFAYFPVWDRQIVIDNHTITNPPFLSRFSGASERPQIYDCQNPTLQFRHDPNKPDKEKAYFSEKIFVAPFSLLWSTKEPENPNTVPETGKVALTRELSTVSMAGKGSDARKPKQKQPRNYDRDFIMVRMAGKTNWRWSLFYIVITQFIPLNLRDNVRPRYYKLDMLDNPAIGALVEYKWNTIGYLLWLARFSIQCVYYLLIVIAACVQVYAEDPKILHDVFVTIIALAVWFLLQELRQFLHSVKEVFQDYNGPIFSKRRWYRRPFIPEYLKSQYNWLDLLAFGLPLVASVFQVDNINKDDPDRAVCLLSFSLVIVFLHMLAELRVIKVVCKYVTIVLRIFSAIKVFFGVFALGILFFSLAIEHILRGRAAGWFPNATNGTDISNSTDKDGIDFPRNFFGAITSTYFIMGGRYDPVNEELSESTNWALHIMIVIYFFFTVILMLNVLIALINNGFGNGEGNWRLVWLENRLRYVESAENMTYRIPGFRQTYDYFPREIYYTATEEQVKEYMDRMGTSEKRTETYESAETYESTKDPFDDSKSQDVTNPESDALTRNVEAQFNIFQKMMDEQMKKGFEEMLKRLKETQ